MKNSFIYIFIFFCLITKNSYSQDIHFSQYYNSPFLINPALTGEFNGQVRGILNYRNQWSSITNNSYKTYAVYSDGSFLKEKFSAGLSLFKDFAGDANMGITQASIALASKVQLDKKNFLRMGILGTWSQNSIDLSKLTWNSQFDGTSINKNINSGEHNNQESFKYFDVSTGIIWVSQFRNNTFFNAGISAFHASKPKYNYLSSVENLGVRWCGHADVSFQAFENYITLNPSLLVMVQNQFKEITFGSLIKFDLEKKSSYEITSKVSDMSFGLYYRNRDAIIVCTQFGYKNLFKTGISYDINLSKLSVASHARGGLEFSLIYIIPEKNKKTEKQK